MINTTNLVKQQTLPYPVKTEGAFSGHLAQITVPVTQNKGMSSEELRQKIALHRKPDLFDQGLAKEVTDLVEKLAKSGKTAKEIQDSLLTEYAKLKGKEVSNLNGREVYAVKYFIYKQSATPQETEESIKIKALSDTYDQVALMAMKVKPLFKAACNQDKELSLWNQLVQKHQQDIARLKGYKLKKLHPGHEQIIDKDIQLLENKIINLQTKILIRQAKLKEQYVKQVYLTEMPKRFEEGFFNPSIVFSEIDRVLGVGNAVLKPKSVSEIKQFIRAELSQLQEQGKITTHQMIYIREVVEPLVDKYIALFRNGDLSAQNLNDTFIFTRNLARAIVYQEIFDKSTFPGSDHGAKHVKNNIQGIFSLHRNMQKGVDFTDKDEFIEQITQIYHDIGYSVGMALINSNCSSDHPLVGAAIIDANKDYFCHYLDQESYTSLRDGILYHSIMLADFREERRAAVSVSDACAVTYDRKAQEFWEQPEALTLISKLILFLDMFPSNESAANKKRCDEYVEKTRAQLLDLVKNNSTINPGKQELFKQAIESQFSSLIAIYTIGQYGGVLADVDVVQAPQNKEGFKYKTHITMAPSLIYGPLKDLFDEDQAARGMGRLCEEFGLDKRTLNPSLDKAFAELTKKSSAAFQETIDKATAVFTVINADDPKLTELQEHGHFPEMQRSLSVVGENLKQIQPLVDRWKKLSRLMDVICAESAPAGRKASIDTFVDEAMQIAASLDPGRAMIYTSQLNEIIKVVRGFESGASEQQKIQTKASLTELVFAYGIERLTQ